MTEIRNLEQLQENQNQLEQNIENFSTPFAFGIGLATKPLMEISLMSIIPLHNWGQTRIHALW